MIIICSDNDDDIVDDHDKREVLLATKKRHHPKDISHKSKWQQDPPMHPATGDNQSGNAVSLRGDA